MIDAVTPTIRAKPTWTLGTAAYLFTSAEIAPWSWSTPEKLKIVSTKPYCVRRRGGAVGNTAWMAMAIAIVPMNTLRTEEKTSLLRRYEPTARTGRGMT